MTEETGAGVIPVSPFVSWTAPSYVEPDIRLEVIASKTYGIDLRHSHHQFSVVIPSDLIDWLIDTLVLAKEQVQGG